MIEQIASETVDDRVDERSITRETASMTRLAAHPPNNGLRFTIRRLMIMVAAIAPLLALARFPFLLALFIPVAVIGVWVAASARRRRYDLIAWLVVMYPALPLFFVHLHWWAIRTRLAGRGSPFFEGLIGLTDVGGVFCLFAYVVCIGLVLRGRSLPEHKRAAKLVVIAMPLAWAGLFGFAIWDPFGALARFFQ